MDDQPQQNEERERGHPEIGRLGHGFPNRSGRVDQPLIVLTVSVSVVTARIERGSVGSSCPTYRREKDRLLPVNRIPSPFLSMESHCAEGGLVRFVINTHI